MLILAHCLKVFLMALRPHLTFFAEVGAVHMYEELYISEDINYLNVLW